MKELYRCITPAGSVIRTLHNGDVQLLMPGQLSKKEKTLNPKNPKP
jgi:hypothetical protein